MKLLFPKDTVWLQAVKRDRPTGKPTEAVPPLSFFIPHLNALANMDSEFGAGLRQKIQHHFI
jgi:hypothetical protein